MSKWKRFQDRYPNADLSRFTQKGWFDDKGVFFVSKNGNELIDVFDGDNFSKEMKKALGLPVGFPLELILNVKPELPITAKKKNILEVTTLLTLKFLSLHLILSKLVFAIFSKN